MIKKSKKTSKAIPKVPFYKKITIFLWQLIRKPRFLASIFIITGCIFLYNIASYNVVSSSIDSVYHKFTKSTNLVLKNIYLEGVNHTKQEELLEVINIKIDQPIFSINVKKIREKIEDLPWVKYATVEVLYPSTLIIRMIEHQPAALWQNKGVLKLIDAQGHIIKTEDLENFANYIILAGEDVPENTENFLAMIYNQVALAKKVSSATRVSQRRWNIYLKNNILVKLPENNPDLAWQKLAQMHKDEQILNGNISSIDLKLVDKIFIKNKL